MSYAERVKHGFLFYDPHESFASECQGVKERRIVSDEGKECGDEPVWKLGKRAYDKLAERGGGDPSNDELGELRESLKELIDIVGPRLHDRCNKGPKFFDRTDGSEISADEFKRLWDEGGIVWKTKTVVEIFDSYPGIFSPTDGFEEWNDMREEMLCLCCLVAIDNVALAKLSESGHIYAYEQARECLAILDRKEKMERVARTQDQLRDARARSVVIRKTKADAKLQRLGRAVADLFRQGEGWAMTNGEIAAFLVARHISTYSPKSTVQHVKKIAAVIRKTEKARLPR